MNKKEFASECAVTMFASFLPSFLHVILLPFSSIVDAVAQGDAVVHDRRHTQSNLF